MDYYIRYGLTIACFSDKDYSVTLSWYKQFSEEPDDYEFINEESYPAKTEKEALSIAEKLKEKYKIDVCVNEFLTEYV